MKVFSVLLAGGASALFFAQSGSSLLQNHVKALQEAPGLTATLNVQPIGGVPATVKITMAKPNLLKIEHDAGWTLSDGTTLYDYRRKDNSWTETPVTDAAILKAAGLPEGWAWRAFFDKDAYKTVASSKVGATRIVKGTSVTELALTLEKGTGTLLIDPKLGVARGFTFKNDEHDLLVTSTDLALSKDPISPANFAFSAPANATKSVAPKPEEGASFSQVQAIMNRACMPCHSAAQRSGGHDFTSYAGIAAGVTPGNSAESAVVRSVGGPNPTMPKFRPRLPAKDVEIISKWVDAGAKRE